MDLSTQAIPGVLTAQSRREAWDRVERGAVDVVVVGGGLAQSGDTLLAPLRDAVSARLTFERPVTIVPASLGDRAGALGAACMAWDVL